MSVGSHDNGTDGPKDGSLTPELVRETLERILASPRFASSDRLRRFLRYVVEETLEGRKDRIKAFTVAMEVFGRDANFDAQNDPVVRIEAGRLRRALEYCYLAAGDDVPVLIDIPKGGYVPTFSLRAHKTNGVEEMLSGHADGRNELGRVSVHDADALSDALRHLGSIRDAEPWAGEDNFSPMVAVLPFRALGDEPSAASYAASVTDELISALGRFKEIRVLGASFVQTSAHSGDERAQPGVRYSVEGSVRADKTQMRINWRLLNAVSGVVLWTAGYDVPATASDLYQVPTELASRIAATVAQPYGAIFRAETARNEMAPPDDVDAYLGTLGFYLYRSDLSAATHRSLRDKLQGIVARHPRYSTAWAMLSYLHLDEDRFGFNRISGAPGALERALSFAREAVRLDPHNARALQALMMALFFTGRPDEALSIGDLARTLNPHDTELLAQIGQIVAMTGRLQEGRSMLEQALNLNLGHTGIYHSNLAFTLYLMGDYEAARLEIEGSDQSRLPLHNAIAIAVYSELGLDDRARTLLRAFEEARPNFFPNFWAEMSRRHLPAAAQARIAESFRKAGANIPPTPAESPHLSTRLPR